MCLEAWKTENITHFEKRNLRACGGDSRYGFLTARRPQTHLPMLQLLAAGRHPYTSSTASLAMRPAFLDTQKLGGSPQGHSYKGHSVGPPPLGLSLRCKHGESTRQFWESRAGITAATLLLNFKPEEYRHETLLETCGSFATPIFPVPLGVRGQQK